ncbi:DNA methyltransferase [Mycobacterium phage Royals2015]|uniref:DNA methylase n=2 Tax=Gracegardnervirinae TaxID=2946632 RepID=A0A385DZP3_9CAUD|nr:DNA methyltransferase [Mycobacterium phage Renaud18]YP_009962000.1 DNA methyltransferase [Mycobacterium phage Royals2015]AXQ64983.1 DNA methylase [Mycobacterium phage Renaud18]QNO12383.1 DNA methylase [Mycobacterium phage Royals2015]
MTPYYQDDEVTLYHGDCLDVIAKLPDNSVDSVCTDPPYGLEFMGKDWDSPDKVLCTASQAVARPDAPGGISPANGRPSFLGGLNPKCTACNRWQRGANPCRCSTPSFTDERGPRLRAFQAWCEQWAGECLRVLKPGGYLVAFGGSRTWHRLACAVEDAGFEIRDSIAWLYGSGFPKSLDVSKAIDKQRDDGADRQAVGAWLRSHREGRGLTQKAIATHWPSATGGLTGCVANWELGLNLPTWDQWLRLKELLSLPDDMDGEVWRLNGRKGEPGEAWRTAEVLGTEDRMNEPSGVVNVGQGARTPVTRLIKAANSEAARQWQGWGTALKPAFEPIVVARKPLAGTVAANVLEHGTGALNIDGCRVAIAPGDDIYAKHPHTVGGFGHAGAQVYGDSIGSHYTPKDGRWPTNVALDDAQAAELDAQTGVSVSRKGKPRAGANGNGWGMTATGAEYDDEGGASRFFPVFRYEAKAPGAERPSVVTTKLRLRADLTPEQVDHVVARLREAGVEID